MTNLVQKPATSVIVVEDEQLVRMSVVDALADEGFHVIEANDAEEALNILKSASTRVDVIFTDVHMPGAMDGVGLVRYVRQHWPWMALIVASGRARLEARELPAGSLFVEKPYNLERLIGHVRRMTNHA